MPGSSTTTRDFRGHTSSGINIALAATFLVAVNLRTGLIGVGPILPHIIEDLGLSNTAGGILVAIPPLLMGVAAIPGGRLADRWGPRRTITLGFSIVVLAGGARALAPEYAVLVLMTFLFGAGIGITQPAFPRLSRNLLPDNIGFATSIYAAGFFLGAVVAAFLTGPVLLPLTDNETWRVPLAIWGAIAGIGWLIWIFALPRWGLAAEPDHAESTPRTVGQKFTQWSPWTDRSTWIVALIFAGQGLSYYLMVAWLPTLYEDFDLTETRSATLYTIFQIATFPAMVGMPIISDRIGSRRIPVLCCSTVFLLGSLGFVWEPVGAGWIWLWPILAGFGVAGLFGMGLLMPADVAPMGKTGITAGMVLAIGYVASGAGPVIGGLINDATGSLETAMAILPAIAVAMIALSWFAPPPRGPVKLAAAQAAPDTPESIEAAV